MTYFKHTLQDFYLYSAKMRNGFLEPRGIADFSIQLEPEPVSMTTVLRHMYAVEPPMSARILKYDLQNRKNSCSW